MTGHTVALIAVAVAPWAFGIFCLVAGRFFYRNAGGDISD